MGGGISAQGAEERPDKVKVLVYLAALLPPNGAHMTHGMQDYPDSLVLSNVVLSDDESSATVRAEALRETFYADCAAEDVALEVVTGSASAGPPTYAYSGEGMSNC
jgi:hypothetical protein